MKYKLSSNQNRTTFNNGKMFFKTLRTSVALLSAVALLGMGGCATNFTSKKALTLFNPGEQSMYGVVPGKPTNIKDLAKYAELKKTCGITDLGEFYTASANVWIVNNICNDLDKWQIVPIVFHINVWGISGIKTSQAYALVELNIEKDDILEYSMDMNNEGKATRPSVVKRIARKAKDATKESGCWWDAGTGMTSSFIGGGAVCDGWSWKDQKFADQ